MRKSRFTELQILAILGEGEAGLPEAEVLPWASEAAEDRSAARTMAPHARTRRNAAYRTAVFRRAKCDSRLRAGVDEAKRDRVGCGGGKNRRARRVSSERQVQTNQT